MSNPKGNTLPNAISMYFVMLAVYCIDIFLFKSDLTVLGDAFYSRFISFVILFLYIWASKDSVNILGISKKKQKFIAGAFYGVIFSVIPLAIIMVLECIYYGITDFSAIDLNFSPPSLNYVRSTENLTASAAVMIYIFTTFFGSAFKEFFFRGFMLKKLKKVMDFGWANIIQALLYMSFILPLLLRNLVNGYYDDTTSRLGAFIIAFYFIHETLAGVKWGLMTRVSGSTYIATVDHFLYVFLSNSIFITNRYVTWSFMTHMLAIQVVSLVFTLVYYKLSMKKILEKKVKEEERKEAERLEREVKRQERHKSIVKKIEGVEEISPARFKDIAKETQQANREKLTDEEILKTKISLEDSLNSPVESTSKEDAELPEIEIDDFLKGISKEMKGHHHKKSGEITDDFDADDFLKAYSGHGSSEHHHHHRHSRHHSHHRQSTAAVKSVEKKAQPKPVKKEMAKKPKLTFAQRMRSLGGIDDSSTNDLI